MNLVDSSGWLEYFADGANADFFASPIEDVDHLIVPTLCLLEVFKRILQQRGEDRALQAIALMYQGQVVALDASIAVNAGKLGFDLKLPLADSVILATAKAQNALIWTQDSDFKDIEGVRYIPWKKK
ncbi:MAG: twitching motility protein PilT [Deltaproteobacteria bacterium RBG_13_47_9]|nr:MAG: twitching motility protein PilT [Deltaproteobacteria bacterium RBG_13_47_9]